MIPSSARRSFSDPLPLLALREIENRVSTVVAILSVAIAVGNFFARTAVYEDGISEAVLHNSVWLTVVLGLIVFAGGMMRTSIGRLMQCIAVLVVASLSAMGATSGDLTSLVYFGLAVLLASLYGLLDRYAIPKLVSAMSIYGLCLALGTLHNEAGATLAVLLNLIAAGFVAYLFVVVAMARLREMQNRQAELARLVAERTSLLQDEVDRRTVAEASMKEIAEHNKALAGDREVLLRELHHRTKNDLQTILSLLSLATGKMERPEFTEFLRPTRDRIRAIALVHEQLDGSERFDTIPVGTYLRRLARHVQASHQDYDVSIQADADAETAVNLESATHLGLLVHELLLCSYTHSFEPGASGTIRLSARVADGTLQVTVSDTGKVLPSTLDPSAPDEDEIAIVEGLVRRLQTTLTLQREPHTCWRAEIPLDVVCRRYTPAVEGAR